MVQPPEDENENQPQDEGNQNEDQDASPDAPSGEGEEDIPAYPDDEDISGPPGSGGAGEEDIPAYPDDEDISGPPGSGGEEDIPAYPDDAELASLPFGFDMPYGYGGQPDPYQYPDDEAALYGIPDDVEPDEETDRRGFALRLSQDTMLLIVVLLFFVIAGISTIIFTTSQQEPQVPIAQLTPSPTTPSDYPSPALPGITPTQRPGYPGVGETTRTPTARTPGVPGYPEPGAAQRTATAEARTRTTTPGTQVATVTGIAGRPGYPGPGQGQTAAPGDTEEPYPPGRTPTSVAQVPTRTPRPLPTRVPPTPVPPPTRVPPTQEPTSPSFPTEDIGPTFTPELVLPTVPPSPVVPPTPAELPYDQMAGDQRWTAAQSPIVVPRSLQLTPGSVLIIEPGVEVRLAPGVSINVDGAQLLALGQPGQPVRFVSQDGIRRWEAIYGLSDSFIVLEHAEISGGGSGGTLLTSDNGELAIRNTRISDNGGAILVNDSKLEMRESEIAGNDIPYGGALTAGYSFGNFVTLLNNRIGGNRLSDGAVGVDISNFNTVSGVVLDVQGNLIRGGVINLRLMTNGPLHGTVACNTLIGNQLGLGIRTRTLQVPAIDLTVANNYIEGHTPPIEPIYLEYGIGRGATSEVLLDMRNNWWGESSGPYHPEENPEGRGDAVGTNILYEPWLTSPPGCTPPE